MGKDRNKSSPQRREVLKLLGLGGVATATAAVAGPAREAKAADGGKPESPGYRETAHVRKYYETTRF